MTAPRKISSPGMLSQKDLTKFENECLAEHNRLRALHGSPPLQLDRDLCKRASEWAQRLGRLNQMEHRPQNEFGENIYMAYGKDVNGAVPVNAWYSEIQQYDYAQDQQPGCAHFTQVVWKNTKRLGVGISHKDQTTYVVCNYNPPGNYLRQFKDNVLPPQE